MLTSSLNEVVIRRGNPADTHRHLHHVPYILAGALCASDILDDVERVIEDRERLVRWQLCKRLRILKGVFEFEMLFRQGVWGCVGLGLHLSEWESADGALHDCLKGSDIVFAARALKNVFDGG